MKKHNQKKEIMWNIINSLLAGLLVLFGSFVDGQVTFNGFIAALIACFIVAVSQFKEYWETEKEEYSTKLFKFVNV